MHQIVTAVTSCAFLDGLGNPGLSIALSQRYFSKIPWFMTMEIKHTLAVAVGIEKENWDNDVFFQIS